MPITAAIYDIHGNLPALEAVLKEIELCNAEQIIVGGDVILGPMPNECLDLLRSIRIPVYLITGNCETAVLNFVNGKEPAHLPSQVVELIPWTACSLKIHHLDWINTWPETIHIRNTAIGNVLFCHAIPNCNKENFTRLTPEEKLMPIFRNVCADVVVCGHTHMQFDRMIGNTRVINAGSVGKPFGKPGAYWLLIGKDVVFKLI